MTGERDPSSASTYLNRAQFFMDQRRYGDAVRELRMAAASEPQNPVPHALVALCLTELKKHDDAVKAGREAVKLAPDYPFAHYSLAVAYDGAEKRKDADSAIKEAIRLDPEDPDFFTFQAGLHVARREWKEAVAEADIALSLQADHIGANNIRALALNKLGKRAEAGVTIDTALSLDPENPVTHANRGWALLEQRDQARALEHFREALRLDPTNEWAREGILEALRARNPIYRTMLRYFFFMSRLSDKMAWAFIIGLWLGSRILRSVARENTAMAPYITPLLVLYFVFIYLSWTAVPIFNLLLRIDPFGRLALTSDQIRASNWVGACLAGAIGGITMAGVTKSPVVAAFGLSCAFLAIPVSATFTNEKPKERRILGGLTIALAVVAFIGIGMVGFGDFRSGVGLVAAAILGFVLFTWYAAFISRRSR